MCFYKIDELLVSNLNATVLPSKRVHLQEVLANTMKAKGNESITNDFEEDRKKDPNMCIVDLDISFGE